MQKFFWAKIAIGGVRCQQFNPLIYIDLTIKNKNQVIKAMGVKKSVHSKKFVRNLKEERKQPQMWIKRGKLISI